MPGTDDDDGMLVDEALTSVRPFRTGAGRSDRWVDRPDGRAGRVSGLWGSKDIGLRVYRVWKVIGLEPTVLAPQSDLRKEGRNWSPTN